MIGGIGLVIALIIAAVLFICFVFYIFFLPITISKRRGLSKENRLIISIFLLLTLLFGITWFIALFLSLWWKGEPKPLSPETLETPWLLDETSRSGPTVNDLNVLEKYHQLKEQGIITEEEYLAEKSRILR